MGTRYKCVECEEFNVCSRCETSTTHVHNFLKIKTADQIIDPVEELEKRDSFTIQDAFQQFFGSCVEPHSLDETLFRIKSNPVVQEALLNAIEKVKAIPKSEISDLRQRISKS